MRYALPIFWCVDNETRGKLAALITEVHAVKKPVWVEWPSGDPVIEFNDYEELFREMSKPPRHPVRMK